MKPIKLSDLIARNFLKTFEMSKTNIVEVGGRASTKSSQNALRVAMSMLEDQKAEWIVIREHDKHHSDSTVKELITAFQRLGLQPLIHFKVTKSPRKITILKTGQVISFAGLDDYEKLKGYKPSSEQMYFRGVWFFEITEMKGELELEQVVSTFARGYKNKYNNLYEFNPAPSKTHWTYEFLEKYKDSEDYQITFSTYEMLTDYERTNWLGKEFLKIINTLKEKNYELYKHIYLGKPMRLEGAIYAHALKTSDKTIPKYAMSIGVDFGWTKSKTYIVNTITDYQNAKVIDTIKYDDPNRDTVSTVDMIVKYALEQREKNKGIQIYVVPDNAEIGMYRTLHQRLSRYGIEVVNMNKIAIEDRIVLVNHMFSIDKLHIDNTQIDLLNAFEEAARDENGKRKDDFTSNIDVIDAFEYSLYPFWRYFNDLLYFKKG